MKVRRMGVADEAVLAVLAREAFDFDLDDRDEGAEPLASEAAQAYLADPSVVHWVAEEDGVVLGHLYAMIVRQRAGRRPLEMLLYEIGVRKNARRRGVGSALVAEMHRFMADRDIEDVWVLADNPEAIAFYESCGFAAGNPEDAVYMTGVASPVP